MSFSATSLAHAQIIYQPVRYQFGGQNPFYYGGRHPERLAEFSGPVSDDGRFGRVNGFAFTAANVQTHRDVVSEPMRVFSDAIPGRNARLFGYTPDDARNDANANLPRFFRMADLRAATIRTSGEMFDLP